MKKKFFLIAAVLIIISCVFCSCSNRERIEDVIQNAEKVFINGEEVSTVEARMGAFSGKAGDSIEFIFDEPQKINTVFITEKTANVRQFNIYAKVDNQYTLVYTSKLLLAENMTFNTVETNALKIDILNTDIHNDSFIIQGVSAYEIKGD